MAYLIGIYIFIVIAVAIIKKVNAYDAFLVGVKEGSVTVINMFSTMLGFVLVVEAIKACGVLEDLGAIINPNIFIQTIIRPFSASSSMAIMLDLYKHEGVDSSISILSTFIHTSLDTSLYIIALYFSSNEIKKYRYVILLVLIVTLISYMLIWFVFNLFFV